MSEANQLVALLVSLGFATGILLLAWQWQQLQREKETGEQQPLAHRLRLSAVLVVWMVVMALLLWWFSSDRAARSGQQMPLAPDQETQLDNPDAPP